MGKKAGQINEVDTSDRRIENFGTLPTNGTRNFTARNVKGRDGNGPCKVASRGIVSLPNGDLAIENDTFDPCVEGMTVARFSTLVAGKYIHAPKDMENKLLKHWDKKTKQTIDDKAAVDEADAAKEKAAADQAEADAEQAKADKAAADKAAADKKAADKTTGGGAGVDEKENADGGGNK